MVVAGAEDSLLDRLESVIGSDVRQPFETYAEAGREIARLRRHEVDLIAQLTGYRAQFQGNMSSHYEHERSVVLAELVSAGRIENERAGRKNVEGALESHARSNPIYRKWLDKKFLERREMFQLEAQLAQVQADLEAARMQREEALQSMRLHEELLRFARAEMGIK